MTQPIFPVLRGADKADSADLLAWRNDPDTRASSRNTQLVDQPEHDSWLINALADANRRIWVAEHDGAKVGTVSATRLDEPRVELSVTVAREWRGRGAGRAMVTAATDKAAAIWPDARIQAVVRMQNAVSRLLFEGCGFREVSREQGYVTYEFRV